MFSRNPNRGAGTAVRSAGNNLVQAANQPTVQQLSESLRRANERIAELESKVQQLLSCIYVDASGGVEISAATRLRLLAGTNVEVVADQCADICGNQEVKLRDQNGNSTRLSSSGISTSASARFDVNAGIVQTSTGMMQVNAGMSKFSGTVQCDTIIANSVVGSSYTPGAGNIW